MQRTTTFLTSLLVGTLLIGAGPAESRIRDQVLAANSDAVQSLQSDVDQIVLAPGVDVHGFITQLKADVEYRKLLTSAQQIGGPRWLDDQTCQIKVELSGENVFALLIDLATRHPGKSPVLAEELFDQREQWSRRSFLATGTSISSERAAQVRPAAVSDSWRAVDDSARQTAVEAARQDAVKQVMLTIQEVRCDGHTVGEVLSNEQANQRVTTWLTSRPITQLEFRDDLRVDLTLNASADELTAEIIAAAQHTQIKLTDPDYAVQLREQLQSRLTTVVGTAHAPLNNATSNEAPTIDPARPPRWIFDPLTSEASADFTGSRLRTARQAQSRATELLRSKLEGMQLGDTTVGQAAKRDANVRRAIEQVLLRSQAYKVDYAADGSVLVKVSIDPREFWESLVNR